MSGKALKVFWERCGPGETNFGDRLTPIILSYVGIACEWALPAQAQLIGIGSVLESVPSGFTGAIWTSGKMHEDTRVDLRAADVIALRGALSLQGAALAAGAAPRLADGGLLCSMFAKKRPKKFKLGVIPHYFHANSAVVRQIVASSPEITLIDICGDPHDIVETIGRCEAIVSSSLHGLITADALEIPNAWVTIEGEREVGGGAFKYRDYYSVFGDPAPQPHRLARASTLDALLELTSGWRRSGLDGVRERALSSLSDVLQFSGHTSSPRELAARLAPVRTSASERERAFLDRLDPSRFVDADTADDADTLSFDAASSVLRQAPAAELAAFFAHCLALLGELRAQGIVHNAIGRGTLRIRNGVPLLTGLEWATTARGPEAFEGDLIALAMLFRSLNAGRYPLIDAVIELMAGAEPAHRVANVDRVAQLFAAAAAAEAGGGAQQELVKELLQQIERRNERLDAAEQRRWRDDAYIAKLEILALLHPAGKVILIDQEGSLAPTFDEPPFIPFLEKNGSYCGLPLDSATAIAELERMRAEGADYVAFTWPVFWWFDYYYDVFGDYVRTRFACALENARLRVFDLRSADRLTVGRDAATSAPDRSRPARLHGSGRIGFDLPLDLLQAVRLVHALMETSFEIQVAPQDEDKFTALREVFGIHYGSSPESAPVLADLEVRHASPLTRVGSISRPLIFAHAVFHRCRERWREERAVEVSFTGLVTERRKRVLEPWLSGARTHGKAKPVVQSSARGRAYPGKSWDADYFALLCDSRYVLCPDGDHVWTYRFFESIICGAIPLVENDSPHYAGFVYATMAEPHTATWSTEAVLHNYALCYQRLTVPVEALEAEIRACLA